VHYPCNNAVHSQQLGNTLWFHRVERVLYFTLAFFLWAGLAVAAPKIRVVCDSVMTWNGDNAIPEVLSLILGEPVDNNARAGARLVRSSFLVSSVEAQFRPARGTGSW